ncbi:hypothetical protein DW651_09770 [Subdoligranulum sp. AM23-21AC]|uniref:Uncharacterized protein n=1 Tax=Ruthenibacterium lactatiformans TaxID=1550024 RepID=A0A0D8J018_9FIRM|nr:hypothetical protein TQ39_07870 [Ruthenibacterium lactatiformans]KUE76778.1 hypothetical protein ASJ35_07180 [Ruthenibacterium lactatiformans]RGD20966.1 hypothetical protein DW651_09770 [Subdoligranulum sp. AM23-21AC]RJW34682.1 hypothetical protein DXC43_00375 [Subdoligranulum sp. TF05-17AC]RJW82555.1 hypothetical protein DXA32_04285 [Subdoligranulum sp. OF01-18]
MTIIHHLRKALFPAPAAQKHPARNLYGQDVLQLVEKATLLRQAAYEQGLRPRSPRTARDYFK